MALTVQNIFNSLNAYRLKLVAGKNGLVNHVSWVYYTEDSETLEFLRGGELAITTGLNVERHKQNTGLDSDDYIVDFLSGMIDEFVKHNASGLIVNTGKYIETIPAAVISLCDRLNFPLFVMPWQIHTIDIMQEVGNKIVLESQKRKSLDQCLFDAIFSKYKFNASELENTVFSSAESFSIVLLEFPDYDFDGDLDALDRYVEFSFNAKLNVNPLEYCWFTNENKIIYVLHSDGLSFAKNLDVLARSDKYFKSSKVSVSDVCNSIDELGSRFEHADVAMKLISGDQTFLDYNELGIFRLFAEVKDKKFLLKMYEEILGKICEFSEAKRADYFETLRLYLESSGKVQKTAEENSTHRNTINYRIHKISEILDVDLQNNQTRYLIQTAIYIKDYLDLLN